MATVDQHHLDPEQLAIRHLGILEPLVRQLASGYPRHVDRDELRSAAAFGLVHAANRFDASDGVPFANYARHRIRGAVLDEVRGRDWAPRSLRKRLREIARVTTLLENRLARHPSSWEVAAELGLAVESVDAAFAQQAATTLLSAELPATPDDEAPIAELLREQDTTVLPADAFETDEVAKNLRMAIHALPERLRRILREHDLGGRPLGEIAEELGVSDARASQLRHEAILALRAVFGHLYEGVPAIPEGAPGKSRRAAIVESLGEQFPNPPTRPATAPVMRARPHPG